MASYGVHLPVSSHGVYLWPARAPHRFQELPIAPCGFLWLPVDCYGSLWHPMAAHGFCGSRWLLMSSYCLLCFPMASCVFLWFRVFFRWILLLQMAPDVCLGLPMPPYMEICVFLLLRMFPYDLYGF